MTVGVGLVLDVPRVLDVLAALTAEQDRDGDGRDRQGDRRVEERGVDAVGERRLGLAVWVGWVSRAMDGTAVLSDATAETTVARASITAGRTPRFTSPRAGVVVAIGSLLGRFILVTSNLVRTGLYFNHDE